MKPHESLAHAFGVMTRLLERELRDSFAEHHILPGQLPVLLALFERDGSTQTEIANATGVEQPTMAATLKRMERDGLVYRAPEVHDGRRMGVFLTAPAWRLEKPVTDAIRAINRRAMRGLSAEERSLLYALPERLRANLGR
jgi:DNA-binding MarR family transcriptional regulator